MHSMGSQLLVESTLVSESPCLLGGIVATDENGALVVSVYDSATAAELNLAIILKLTAAGTLIFSPSSPIAFHNGIYVTLSGGQPSVSVFTE